MRNEYTRLHVLYIIDCFVCYRNNYNRGVCANMCVTTFRRRMNNKSQVRFSYYLRDVRTGVPTERGAK